jgi:hypothetical protein
VPTIFDHAPIILQLDIGLSSIAHPFEFNPVWLLDDSFATLASEVWYPFLKNEKNYG